MAELLPAFGQLGAIDTETMPAFSDRSYAPLLEKLRGMEPDDSMLSTH